jgi:hypothetical protein
MYIMSNISTQDLNSCAAQPAGNSATHAERA